MIPFTRVIEESMAGPRLPNIIDVTYVKKYQNSLAIRSKLKNLLKAHGCYHPRPTRLTAATILGQLYANPKRNCMLKHLKEVLELLIETYLDISSPEVV